MIDKNESIKELKGRKGPIKTTSTTYTLSVDQVKIAIMSYLGLDKEYFDEKKISIREIMKSFDEDRFGMTPYEEFDGIRIVINT